MKYIIEIDADNNLGAQLLKYIADMHAPANVVKIHKASTLTDEEMALPGKKPTKEQLEEWLSLPDYGFVEADEALALLKEELATYRKTKK